jgi:hypothetical protein
MKIYSRYNTNYCPELFVTTPIEDLHFSGILLIAVWQLPYVQTMYGHLSRMLAKHNINGVGLLPRKISSFLHPVKDDLGLRTPGVYSIPCECGQVYIRQTGQSIETRINEHNRHIRLGHPDILAVVEQRINHDHLILF